MYVVPKKLDLTIPTERPVLLNCTEHESSEMNCTARADPATSITHCYGSAAFKRVPTDIEGKRQEHRQVFEGRMHELVSLLLRLPAVNVI